MADAAVATDPNAPLNPDVATGLSNFLKAIGNPPTTTTNTGDTGALAQLVAQLQNLGTPQGAQAQIAQVFKAGNEQYMPGINNTVNASGYRAGTSTVQALQVNDLNARLAGQASVTLNNTSAQAAQAAAQLAQANRQQVQTQGASTVLGSLALNIGSTVASKKATDYLTNLFQTSTPAGTMSASDFAAAGGLTPASTAGSSAAFGATDTGLSTAGYDAASGTVASDAAMFGGSAPASSMAVDAFSTGATAAATDTAGTAAVADTGAAGADAAGGITAGEVGVGLAGAGIGAGVGNWIAQKTGNDQSTGQIIGGALGTLAMLALF